MGALFYPRRDRSRHGPHLRLVPRPVSSANHPVCGNGQVTDLSVNDYLPASGRLGAGKHLNRGQNFRLGSANTPHRPRSVFTIRAPRCGTSSSAAISSSWFILRLACKWAVKRTIGDPPWFEHALAHGLCGRSLAQFKAFDKASRFAMQWSP